MPKARVSDEEFIDCFKRLRSPQKVSHELDVPIRNVYKRRNYLQQKYNIELVTFTDERGLTFIPENKRVIQHEIQNGHIFIASDCHYWPDQVTAAHQAFVRLIKDMRPQTIVLNGDVFDGAQVSRHPPLMGVTTPTPKQEIEACQDRLSEIAAASKNAKKFWTFGNHDVRLFSRLASSAPELTDMVSLFDYFPEWKTCWRLDVNDSLVIKHRWHNGIHAVYNNVLKSGKSIVTGHLHQLKVTPYSDYRDCRRWGVDSGTLAEPYGDQFTYTEMNPVNWCSGFVVLTIKDGILLPPELCEVLDGVAYFRGKEI